MCLVSEDQVEQPIGAPGGDSPGTPFRPAERLILNNANSEVDQEVQAVPIALLYGSSPMLETHWNLSWLDPYMFTDRNLEEPWQKPHNNSKLRRDFSSS